MTKARERPLNMNTISTHQEQELHTERRILMKHFHLIAVGLLTAGLLVLGLSSTSFAAIGNADAGNTISNLATLNYFVDTVAQPPLESAPGGGNTTGGPGNGTSTDFVVDHKIRPVVVSNGNTTVIPGATDQALHYTVTNDGNTDADTAATLDIQLIAQQLAGDDFNMSTVRIFIDDDGTPGLDILTDTDLTTTLGSGSEIISLERDTSAEIYVVSNTPAGQSDSDQADIVLIGTAFESGAIMTETAAATAGVDKVFADDAGTSTDIRNDATNIADAAFDGVDSDTGSYEVGSVILSVAKNSSIIYDPIGGGFHVPGAYVQYSITIDNDVAATQSALLTNITDILDATLALDPDLYTALGAAENAAGDAIRVSSGGISTRANAGAGNETYHTGDVGDDDTDGGSYTGGNGGTVVTNLGIVLPVEAGYLAGELKPGESVTITFNAIIQ